MAARCKATLFARGQVQVTAPKDHRMIGRGGVEIVTVRQASVGPGAFVPTLALQPLAGLRRSRGLSQQVLNCRQRYGSRVKSSCCCASAHIAK